MHARANKWRTASSAFLRPDISLPVGRQSKCVNVLRLLTVAAVLLLVHVPQVHARDGRDVFGQILGGILGEIDRQQAQGHGHRHPLFSGYILNCRGMSSRDCRAASEVRLSLVVATLQKCANGDSAACDEAIGIHDLAAQPKAAVEQQRTLLSQQRQAFDQQFISHWNLCIEKQDAVGCSAALRHPNLSAEDRGHLLNAQTVGLERQRRQQVEQAWAEAQQRRRQQQAQQEFIAQERERTRIAAEQKVAIERQQAEAQRRAELAEVTAREQKAALAKLVAETQQRAAVQSEQTQRITGIVFLLAAVGLVAGFHFFGWRATIGAFVPTVLARMSAASGIVRDDPPPPTTTAPILAFDLTGHFPTDVRAILEMNELEVSRGR